VLLAEGSLFNRRLAVALLEKQGHAVVVASNGPAAVHCFRTSEFDFVILDAQMPDLDATAAAMRIHELTAGAHVPIIALTAAGNQAIDTDVLDGFIQRPLDAAGLTKAISRHAPSTEPSTAIDWEVALQIVEGRRQLLRELVQIFLDDHSRMLAQIDQAIATDDGKNLQVHAHGMKGCLRYFGDTEAVELAKQLEGLGGNNDLAGAPGLSAQLADAVQRLLPTMQEFASAES
jgi:two-component system sensor histidine kinase/response regulator